ncbi:MAG: hypothetical protein A3J83_07610 [Elusimicrobia bacterium RIFOXYA2_FULL_40_6]|nr:MAG: hypothetical protein A3J83_07610 [Elusimicrobia bacterium RIFOXYA2_FULL_40_6]
MNKNIGKILLGLILMPACLYGAFEETGPGAAPVSMGGAFTAQPGSIYSQFYNPAGVTYIGQTQIAADYTSFFEGLSDKSSLSNGNFALGIPLNRDVVGMGLSYNSLGLSGVYSEQTIRLALGWRMKDWLSLGLGLKMMDQKYLVLSNPYYAQDTLFAKGNTASIMDGDLGLMIRPSGSVTIGARLGNVFQNKLGIEESNKIQLPAIYRVGIMYSEDTMNLGLDLQKDCYFTGSGKNTGSLWDNSINFGFEKYLIQFYKGNGEIAIRTGLSWGLEDSHKNISVGFGLDVFRYSLDYAWVFPVNGIEGTSGTHRFSFVTKFGKIQVKERIQKTARYQGLDSGLEMGENMGSQISGSAGVGSSARPSSGGVYNNLGTQRYFEYNQVYPSDVFYSPVAYGPAYMVYEPATGSYTSPYSSYLSSSNPDSEMYSYKTSTIPVSGPPDFSFYHNQASTPPAPASEPVETSTVSTAAYKFVISTESVSRSPAVNVSSKSAEISVVIISSTGVPNTNTILPGLLNIKSTDTISITVPADNQLEIAEEPEVSSGAIKGFEPIAGVTQAELKEVKQKTPVRNSGGSIRYHKIKSGENLKSIAQEYYGDSGRWVEIYKINEDKIDKGSLRPGDSIIIP